MVKQRNIAVSIILSIITCGIYGIYWFIVMTDETARLNDNSNMSGGMSFLFSLLTCGLYTIYWSYKMGKELYSAGEKKGIAISDNSVIYLVLSVFGLGIVNYIMIQSDINKFAQ